MYPKNGDTVGEGSYFRPQDASREAARDVAPDEVTATQTQAADLPAVTPPTPTSEQPPVRPPATAVQDVAFRPLDRQPSVIRVRRLRGPSFSRPAQASRLGPSEGQPQDSGNQRNGGRHRSSSTPQPPVRPQDLPTKPLPPVPEEHVNVGQTTGTPGDPQLATAPRAGGWHRLMGRRRQTVGARPVVVANPQDCYDSRIVDLLDVIDPEVAALSSITNVQNSLFVPSLGRWVNRRPTYDLSALPKAPKAFSPSSEDVGATEEGEEERPPTAHRAPSLSSVLTAPQYAILPDDATLEGWSEEDVKLLNDYVRHMLHSRRSKVKQQLKAFGKYARRPLGFLVTLYATLITLFGLAWVLFLIGWIYVGDKQLYAITVIDYVLVALFAVVGDGLAPFRAIDTYHMIYVAHYHRKTWKLRNKLLLPKLQDHNDLPTADRNPSYGARDIEAARDSQEKQDDAFYPVLSDKEQAALLHHQSKLSKSHTFYKPHETETHHAFPLRLLITVVLLLDLHSCLQISLGACTWGMPHHPAALTTTILCCSIATNAVAGIVISIGDRMTRKKDVLERLMKQDLTGEAMRKVKKQRQKEEDAENGEGGLLGIPAPPFVDKMRKGSGTSPGTSPGKSPGKSPATSPGKESESPSRKSRDQIGRFDAAISRVSEEEGSSSDRLLQEAGITLV